ncbi:hypothetical protein NQ318_018701 [Aromia moschata]|uniref:TBC1 domain family member 31 n=1 Tax=Aromia moschata TaxID=1265417 RepID=A0AAV8ZH22_9CUCU|nr:hypothetical protein NQ318_018701 [Aromia moschata]
MNFIVPLNSSADVKKTLFKLKPVRRDGLVLNVHHSKENKKIRFVHCCFHHTGHIVVAADNDGHFYVIDFSSCKFWGLPKLDSCTFIKFSAFSQNEILSGRKNGDVYVIDYESGNVTGKLMGHKYPIRNVSFAENHCLTASDCEAIIWDMQTNTKIQVLTLEKGSSLKQVVYMPLSNNILVCFQDDLIQIWNSSTFESVKQFLPINWNNFTVKSIAFSRNNHIFVVTLMYVWDIILKCFRNGQVMIVAGYLPTLTFFLLDKWKLSKRITLPEYIHTIRSIEFVPQPFDGGCNKILMILAGQGIIYFYDIEQNVILSELTANCEIIKAECSPNGAYVARVLCSGEIEIYQLNQYIMPPVDLKVENVKKPNKIKLRTCSEKVEHIKDQINNVLDSDKLKAILKEYGEYPEIHRLKIWERLLQLPNNTQQYNSVINHVTIVSFKDLYTKYPLESTGMIKCLKQVLNNVVTWCPFFAHVEYLPVFTFPFVKVFQNKPVACFEAICTVILNWCQYWFEYFPLPPMNVLAIAENVLTEHEPELFNHLSSYNITANLYAWSLLETAFSEVLTASEWLTFWDHVLTNEPSFLICAVISYNIIHKNILTCLRNMEEFEFFYHNQNPNDIKKFIRKTYFILNNTSDRIHPKQYLAQFNCLDMGNYPLFLGYPKTIIDLHNEHAKELNTEMIDLERYENRLIKEAKRKWKESNVSEVEKEEVRRKKEMMKANSQNLQKEEEAVRIRQSELQAFRKSLEKEQQGIFDDVRKKSDKKPNKKRNSAVDRRRVSPKLGTPQDLSKIQEQFLKSYTELLKCLLDTVIICGESVETVKAKATEVLNQPTEADFQHAFNNGKVVWSGVRKSLVSTEGLKKLNLATSILVMEKLIKNIEEELQRNPDMELSDDVVANMRLKTLQQETKGLEKEIAKLLRLISKTDVEEMPPHPKEKPACCCGVSCPKTVRFTKLESSLSSD